MVKAIKYMIDICVDQYHGFYKTIDELFIPEAKVCVNIHNGEMNIFYCPTDRSDPEISKPVEIDIPDEIAKQLVPRTEELKNKVKSILSSI